MKSFLLNLLKKEKTKQKILIFCGAGISAESGLSTFRDKDGTWDKYDLNEVCNLKTFSKNKEKVFEFYNNRKKEMLSAKYNEAHKHIAEIQKKYTKEVVKIFTSNVDNLLEQAGCENVCHVHGDIHHMKCLGCEKIWNIGNEEYDILKLCPFCNSKEIKPSIIFFNEQASEYGKLMKYFESSGEIINKEIVPNIKLFVGTSFQVLKPYIFRPSRGRSILVDLNPNVGIYEKDFEIIIKEKATKGLPIALTHLNDFIKK